MIEKNKQNEKNIKEFSFAEMTSNSDGKTSSSGFSGVYLVIIGGIVVLLGSACALFTNAPQAANVLLCATGVITIGAGLLGYRKSKDGPITSDRANVGKNDIPNEQDPS